MRRGHRGCRSGTSKKNRSQKNARALRRRCCDVDTDDEFEKLPDTKRQPLFLQYLIDPPSECMVSASAALKTAYGATNRRPLFLQYLVDPPSAGMVGGSGRSMGVLHPVAFRNILQDMAGRQNADRQGADTVPTGCRQNSVCWHPVGTLKPANRLTKPTNLSGIGPSVCPSRPAVPPTVSKTCWHFCCAAPLAHRRTAHVGQW